MKKQIQNKKWFVFILIFSILGLAISAYLTYIHYKVYSGDDSFSSFCNINSKFNCDLVAASEWSMFFGIPVSVWGFAFYLFYATSSILRLFFNKLKNLSVYYVWSASVAMIGVVVLAYISKVIIGTWCIMCVASWVVNFFLLIFSVLSCHVAFNMHCKTIRQGFFWLFGKPLRIVLIVFLGVLFFTTVGYSWNKETKRLDEIKKQAPKFKILKNPITLTGYSYGSDNPRLTIVEFSDLQCPFCKKLHHELKNLVKKFKDLKVIHKDYPLDQACHPMIKKPFHKSSCKAALFTQCAGKQNRYWEAVDYVFKNQNRLKKTGAIETFITELGLDVNAISTCMEDKAQKDRLSKDIQEGISNRFSGTPVIIFNGTKQLTSKWTDGKLQKIIKYYKE